MKKFISSLLILTMLASMVCISTSAAGVRINMNFESMEAFSELFHAGQFYVEDGLLYGYNEARALQTKYEDPEGWFNNQAQTWLTYDTKMTICMADDELSDAVRSLNLCYANDNLVYMGRGEDRIFMSFTYDVENACFRLTEGWENFTDEGQIMEPVYREIDTEGGDFFTIGMSVEKDRIRCFYNDELIYDFKDTARDYLIADQINSPFLFWQRGNFVQISNITVADAGYLYPHATEPVTSETTTAGGDDNVTTAPAGEDTTVVTTTKETTTRVESSVVVKDDGETEIVTEIITEPTPADTNTGKPQGGSSTATGDATFVVIAAMVATLGCALIVRKVNAR